MHPDARAARDIEDLHWQHTRTYDCIYFVRKYDGSPEAGNIHAHMIASALFLLFTIALKAGNIHAHMIASSLSVAFEKVPHWQHTRTYDCIAHGASAEDDVCAGNIHAHMIASAVDQSEGIRVSLATYTHI